MRPFITPTSVVFDDSRLIRAEDSYRKARLAHWDAVARRLEGWSGLGAGYQRRLIETYRFLVPPGRRILEVGCGTGDLLAALDPDIGVGVDISSEMILRARAQHPRLTFVVGDVHNLDLGERFDVIILSDLLNDLWDVQVVLERLQHLTHAGSRVIMNFYSRLWAFPLAVAQKLRLAKPVLAQNWLTREDVGDLLHLADFEVLRGFQDVLWPFPTPLLSAAANRFLVKLWPFRHLALTNFLIARPRGRAGTGSGEPIVSVIVPARNEAGNIEKLLARVPEMGAGTEIIFVEGHSGDDTYSAILNAMARHPERRCQLHRQAGKGKGDAVRLGFAKATGDVLMILDADLTVPPEDLLRFYEALRTLKGDLINGVRLVYPMEAEAMRFPNFLANKFFSVVFTFLLGQPVKDTLCGTKVLWKKDYEKIAGDRAYFGDFDPFGDFDLLFGAAKQGLKMIDLPIRYRQRTYGTTNISRWRHGVLLLRMAAFAAHRIKFV
jgi:SAM-dependent methyltransferase